MAQEYKIKKGQYYFLGPKYWLPLIQIIVFLLFSVLAITINPWFYLASAVSYVIFYYFIRKQLSNMSYVAYFFSNCKYKLSENYDQINKLFGVSNTYHHWNSARIGWRCLDYENIELLAYCYVNGKRLYKKIATVQTNTDIKCSIRLEKDQYVFGVISGDKINETCVIPRSKNKISDIFMYKLYPYFGGSIPAPHFMKIHLERLKNE